MKITPITEKDIVTEIQAAKSEALQATNQDSETISMGVVTKNSEISKVMIGEQEIPKVETITTNNKNTIEDKQAIETDKSNNLTDIKDKIKSINNSQSKSVKKEGKLGL